MWRLTVVPEIAQSVYIVGERLTELFSCSVVLKKDEDIEFGDEGQPPPPTNLPNDSSNEQS